MPDAHDLNRDIDAMDAIALHSEYNRLKAELGPNPGLVEDDDKLSRMVVILGALRRKSAGPPRSGGASKSAKIEPSLEDLQ